MSQKGFFDFSKIDDLFFNEYAIIYKHKKITKKSISDYSEDYINIKNENFDFKLILNQMKYDKDKSKKNSSKLKFEDIEIYKNKINNYVLINFVLDKFKKEDFITNNCQLISINYDNEKQKLVIFEINLNIKNIFKKNEISSQELKIKQWEYNYNLININNNFNLKFIDKQ